MADIEIDSRNVNSLWASVLVETFVRAGVRHAVVSPGSRSTPLTMALARHGGIEAIPVLDERSASFFALGLAKRTGAPTALVCTSGTAGANYFPAVIEAQESRVPLVVLTADRPPELRACGSGQTIDQVKLFGGHVEFFHEFAVPEAGEAPLRYVRQMALHAVDRAVEAGGPVHLNVPLRDPLPPLPDDGSAAKTAAAIDWPRFFGAVAPAVRPLLAGPSLEFAAAVHGLIVVGPRAAADASAEATLVGRIAAKLGWPVLADGLTPLRTHARAVPNLVTTYDLVLRNPAVAERLRPEVVLCLGEWPTSKVLRAWLEANDGPVWFISDRADNRDALHSRARRATMSLAALPAALPQAAADNDYTRRWARYDRAARIALDDALGASDAMFEGRAAWLLAQHLPPETPLFVANSMPARDVEYFWPPGECGAHIYFNRGANGIDGTLSTALGVAHGGDRPAVLLTGDLALLHDTNGFLLRAKFRGSLTIVLINNRGGGIFEHLPVAQFEPPFEEFFATPQAVDFAGLCASHGVEHVTVRDWAHFTALVATLPARGLRVLELPTDRKRDAARRKQMFAAIAAGL
ncbi:MAG: 2-succinyl-5-enolpyruvyl-6-hydroxy-3-cyclohexene-1-carboxylic-acid synthase [Verrucomicrobia bacterium]|nr:2-succinyl-5-enolpyruvyl-6-hydroxy-3-cyclohexene-1-carboxylic-acid synthase [Verrucomicrobiota bacterium]